MAGGLRSGQRWWILKRRRLFLLPFCNFAAKAVALSHHRLQELRLLRVILQNLADFPDRGVDALLGIQEDLFAPKPFADLFSGDQFPAVLAAFVVGLALHFALSA